MPNSNNNLEIIKAAYDAFFAGDLDRFFGHYDNDIVLIEAETLPYGGTYRGREAAIAMVGHVLAVWDDINLDIKTIAAEDDWVIAYGTFSAVGKATGIRVSYPLAEIWRLANGKVTFLNPVYGDTAMAIKALGA